MENNSEKLKRIIKKYPFLSKTSFCDFAGINANYMYKFVNNGYNLPETQVNKALNALNDFADYIQAERLNVLTNEIDRQIESLQSQFSIENLKQIEYLEFLKTTY